MIAAAKQHLLLASPLTLFSIANFIINWRGRTARQSSTWHTSTRAQVSCLCVSQAGSASWRCKEELGRRGAKWTLMDP
ncbi:hypothetical protein B0J15DRAFT_480086 [Fusarium solani]|uniref:Uncharacterized protein n=1 Tax=Fusarium solani TaxID=169388 RepID=A0A9P9L5D4_FUSSL|nr:uncharacterized protein B0J15DRAFT_480086 [Fusarium solani]KAH7274544.1 hypothetical protein B0J15DRAFT_480086 [Fusarium solani]